VLVDCSRNRRQQLGVLAGLRVKLFYGLLAPRKTRPLCRRGRPYHRFHPARVTAHHRRTKGGKGTAAAILPDPNAGGDENSFVSFPLSGPK